MANLMREDALITSEQETHRLSPDTQPKVIVTHPENLAYKARRTFTM
jgi:hypothetical protein